MKIRTQLLGIITIITSAFIISAAIFFSFEHRISQIEKERAVLTELRTSLSEEAIFLTTFCFNPLSTTLEDYQEVIKKTDESFDKVASIRLLPGDHSSITESIGVISEMKKSITERRESLFMAAEAFFVQGEKVGGFRHTLRLMNFSLVRYYSTKPGYDEFLVLSTKLSATILVMNQSFTNSISVIDSQYEIIDAEIQNFAQRSILISIIAAAIMGLSGIFLSILMANRISRRVVALENAVRMISSGDLRHRIELSGKDELGELGGMMEDMRTNLTDSMGRLKTVSETVIQSRDQLLFSVENSGKELAHLNAEADSIGHASDSLDGSIDHAHEAIIRITGEVSNVDSMIQSQAAMVEESTAAITEMASSITSLNTIMERNKDGATRLKEIAGVGETRLNETSDIIKKINESITTIQDMADLINGIAARTNLLAMNAAIEAAHAGEFGKGFSVVADEIRTLAEASATNAKMIVKNITNVVRNITDASFASAKTAESFQQVNGEISQVSNSFDEIVNGLHELKNAGSQIMEAMVELNTYTTTVTDNTATITTQAESLTRSMDAVKGSGLLVAQTGSKVKTGLGLITDNFATVDTYAKMVGAISEQLDDEISKFEIEGMLIRDLSPAEEGVTSA